MKYKLLVGIVVLSAWSGSMAGPDCAKNPTHSSCDGSPPDTTLEERVQYLEARLANSDFDGDGYTPAQNDCDDTDPGVHPNAPDLASEPDGIDNDCDGEVDNDYAPPDPDNDGDGYPQSVDCDDSDQFVYPDNPNWYPDGKDHDCDYQVTLQTPLAIFYYDGDIIVSCEVTQSGFATEIDVPCGQTGTYLDAGETASDAYSNQDCRDKIVNNFATSRTQMCQ